MAHSKKDGRHGGAHGQTREIWGSRRNSKKVRGCLLNRATKTKTHRNERREATLETANDYGEGSYYAYGDEAQ